MISTRLTTIDQGILSNTSIPAILRPLIERRTNNKRIFGKLEIIAPQFEDVAPATKTATATAAATAAATTRAAATTTCAASSAASATSAATSRPTGAGIGRVSTPVDHRARRRSGKRHADVAVAATSELGFHQRDVGHPLEASFEHAARRRIAHDVLDNVVRPERNRRGAGGALQEISARSRHVI